MKPFAVLYATREGHTRRIAEHVAAAIRSRGHAADVVDVSIIPPSFSLKSYQGAIVAASVHVQKHEPEMVRYVKEHVAELESIPSVFLSVSLAEASAEDPDATPEHRQQAAADAGKMMQNFLTETGWHPSRIQAVAGALMYTKYNFVIRFVMKMIARRAGGSTDTSHDHEYTDWQALDHLVDELLRENRTSAQQ
jgi:menaquinone-dependent protoporphyrinogen oxidase